MDFSKCLIAGLLGLGSSACPGSERMAEGVQDNSFLIEEAYNQEPGVVQHIFNLTGSRDKMRGPDDRAWTFTFTQEWPGA